MDDSDRMLLFSGVRRGQAGASWTRRTGTSARRADWRSVSRWAWTRTVSETENPLSNISRNTYFDKHTKKALALTHFSKINTGSPGVEFIVWWLRRIKSNGWVTIKYSVVVGFDSDVRDSHHLIAVAPFELGRRQGHGVSWRRHLSKFAGTRSTFVNNTENLFTQNFERFSTHEIIPMGNGHATRL